MTPRVYLELHFLVDPGLTSLLVQRWHDAVLRDLGAAIAAPVMEQVGAVPKIGRPFVQYAAYPVDAVETPHEWYTPDGYRQFLHDCGREAWGSELAVGVLASKSPPGVRAQPMPPFVVTNYYPFPSPPELGWLRLNGKAPVLASSDVDAHQRLVALLHEIAAAHTVLLGRVKYSYDQLDVRPLVLMVADEVGERAGGVEGLQATGFFQEVSRLPRGGYWLQVGNTIHDLDRESAARLNRWFSPLASAAQHLMSAHVPANDSDDRYRP